MAHGHIARLNFIQSRNTDQVSTRNEQEMARLLRLFHQTQSRTIKRRLWAAYAELHAQRTPAQVEALERAKGLFRG